MEKTSKPTVAGILDIIAGVLGLIAAVSLFIGFGVTSGALGIHTGPIPAFVPGLVMGMGILTIIFAILALMGGIYALQRKKWGLALVGSIGALFTAFLLGIPALVFTAMSRNEFA